MLREWLCETGHVRAEVTLFTGFRDIPVVDPVAQVVGRVDVITIHAPMGRCIVLVMRCVYIQAVICVPYVPCRVCCIVVRYEWVGTLYTRIQAKKNKQQEEQGLSHLCTFIHMPLGRLNKDGCAE